MMIRELLSSASFLSVSLLVLVSGASASDHVLKGTVTSLSGEKLAGVAVSAKLQGSTITTTVYTDETGAFYFPAQPTGKYNMWTNALGFGQSRSSIELNATKSESFTVKVLSDFEDRWRQLPGDEMLAALPDASPEDRDMKRIFRNNCTGCHTPSFVLQHKFDQTGWKAVVDLMKKIPGTGVAPGPEAKANDLIEFNEEKLTAYLAKVRGPGETPLKIGVRPRPTGEAARVVFKEYDLPFNPDAGIGLKQQTEDGSDWTAGTPSKLGTLMHDAWLGVEGDLWFTSNNLNRDVSIGRVDTKTGQVTFLKALAQNGLAATAHGLSRDKDGNFWFDINAGRRSLGRLDTRTQEIKIFSTPNTMMPLGGAVTVDVDGKGKIWASAPEGVLRFDPETEKFTEFKALTYKTPNGNGITYGAAGDRDGNGWWAQMPIDIIGKANMTTGQSEEIRLPPVQGIKERQGREAMKVYESYTELSFNHPLPWQQGPRRMGTDKNADVLYVGNSWGGSLAKINTKTGETKIIPMPNPDAQQPYHIAVDSQHNAWGNLWNADSLFRYDPQSGKFTIFDLPRRGSEVRYISLDETGGALKVVTPEYRTSQISIMSFRSESEIAALKTVH